MVMHKFENGINHFSMYLGEINMGQKFPAKPIHYFGALKIFKWMWQNWRTVLCRHYLTWLIDDPGTSKLAIWLFKTMPDLVVIPEPNQEFTDLQKKSQIAKH